MIVRILRRVLATAAVILLSRIAPASAFSLPDDWLPEGWQSEWNNRFSIGAAIRTEAQDPRLIGKSNLNPQLCAVDDCLSASPNNLAPNNRYLAAPGARNSIYDEGDLNYAKGDFIASPVKLNSRLKISKGNLKFEAGFLGFYDYVNATLKENHPNEIVTPGPQPGVAVRSRRPQATLNQIGYGTQLLDTYVQDTFDIFGQPFDFSIGRQRLVWGEASFATQGSLNVINPPDANNLVRPGGELDEVYRPQGMLVFRGPVNDDLTAEGFYQFEWRPVGIPPRGAYISFFNAGNQVTPNEGVIAPFAKAPYDPLQIGTPANDVFALVTHTSFTIRRGANHNPNDQGQLGLALYYHPEWLYGSELGFYFANYHSRIPSASATASQASCTRREGNPNNNDATDLVSLINDCGVPGASLRDAVPLGTGRYFLEYPENIHLLGASFSSFLGGLAVRGEVSYRPNQPVQVDLEDVLFAAFQPALPRQDIPLFSTAQTLPGLISAIQTPGSALNALAAAGGNLPGVISTLQSLLNAPNLIGTTVPGSRTALPDFITAYRGGTPGEIAPGQYVRGYERLGVEQSSIGLTKVYGNSHFLGTADAALLLEVTNIWVPGLPSRSRLQFEGPGTDTHAGPGAFDTGNALRINPIQNVGGYVTEFSWGYRLGALLHYKDVWIPGLDVNPFLVFTHDVSGVSPGLAENFLQGRKLGVVDVRFAYRNLDFNLIQTVFFGGGTHNTLSDRDFFSASIGLRF